MRFRMKKIGVFCWHKESFSSNRNQKKYMSRDLPVTPTNIITYCFARVPFSKIPSPFLLGATMKHYLGKENGTDEGNTHRDMYVNNLITGVDNKEEASRLLRAENPSSNR